MAGADRALVAMTHSGVRTGNSAAYNLEFTGLFKPC